MKSATAAAGPYEFFRWKSSRGRLVVRTTWVKGVRHVVLSDDDEKEKRQPSAAREKNTVHRKTTMPANRQALSAVCASDSCVQQPTACDGNDDNYYVERVLQWLQKPSAMLLETQRRNSVSAPGNGNGDSARSRRPALVKTCSIPENGGKFDEDQQVVEITKRSAKFARRNNNNNANNCTQNRHKIELHVHIPPTCSTSDDN